MRISDWSSDVCSSDLAVLEDDATVGAVFVLALLEAVAARAVGLWKIDALEGQPAQQVVGLERVQAGVAATDALHNPLALLKGIAVLDRRVERRAVGTE